MRKNLLIVIGSCIIVLAMTIGGIIIMADNTSQKYIESKGNTTNALSENYESQISENQDSDVANAYVSEKKEVNSILYGSVNFQSDLTHDGINETIQVTVDDEDSSNSADPDAKISISIIKGNHDIYNIEDIPAVYELEQAYYMTSFEGKDYIMYYSRILDSDRAFCEFEVFSLDEYGNKIVLDSDEIEVSLSQAGEMDTALWIEYAEKENLYFENAILLVSTLEGELTCGSLTQTQIYQENFDWMVENREPSDSSEENLQIFMEQSMESSNQASENTEISSVDLYSVTEESGYTNNGFSFYICEKTGDYDFHLVNPTDTVWKVYILNEEWQEAVRFIGQVYQPELKLSAGLTEGTLKINEGQYIYIYCNKYIGFDEEIEEDVELEFGIEI